MRNLPASSVVAGGNVLPPGYAAFLDVLKARVGVTRVRAALAANRELIVLY